MELLLDNNILNTVRDISKELELEKDLDGIKKELGKVLVSTVDKVATYTIKAMPIPDGFKDVLYDVKEAFKTKDFKEVVSTAVSSSVREGLEILGLDKAQIKSIGQIKDVAQKGGLMYGIKAGIEIVAKKYLKNNLVGNYVYDFFNKLKDAPLSSTFVDKVEGSINKITEAKEEFLNKCNEFKEAYENFDMDRISVLAKDVEKSFKSVHQDMECIRKNKTIQNIFTLVSNKKEKLTDAQLKLCNMM